MELPWELTLENQKSGSFLYLSAQKDENQITGGYTVEVQILVDGVPVREATATAPNGIATASGTL
jgi:hypothetical protein